MKCMLQSFYAAQLAILYGEAKALQVLPRLLEVLHHYRGRIPTPAEPALTERDSILITYADQLFAPEQPPLQTLAEFCRIYLDGVVSTIHILPFFPSSSDDGFSVKNYRHVDSALGDWRDIERMADSFRLMFDAVINHASVQGEWFQGFLRDGDPYREYFLTVTDTPDLSKVVRPRVFPLLTEFQTASGKRRVWTTFSADQADLDFHNPEVLLEIVDIVLLYAQRGAQFIRLDAIAYIWKEIGTSCIHLPQTHTIVQILRAVLDDVAPFVRLVTETNVSHSDNLSYFGTGHNEAHLVYNFALPPLVLHTFRTGDASILSLWASALEPPSDKITFLNFLASHDGIGLNPARGILPPAEIDALVAQTLAHGGLISYKQSIDGTQIPYELNINYFDALSDPSGNEPLALQIDRFMAAQAIMLSLRGLPGIYFHSLFGSRNWQEGVQVFGRNRLINREKLARNGLEKQLADPESLRAQVFERYRRLLVTRSNSAAFHPYGRQEILEMGSAVFAVLRSSPGDERKVLCLQNVTAQRQAVSRFSLGPYETIWQEYP
jgi:glucosylglycerate phosphorylase